MILTDRRRFFREVWLALFAGVLFAQPDLLLLDEPTNHLDIRMREWLEGWLQDFGGAVILTSHDRDFLDAVAGRSLWLEGGEAQEYAGGYSRARAQRELERRTQSKAARLGARGVVIEHSPIVALLENPAERERLATGARARVMERYSWAAVARRMTPSAGVPQSVLYRDVDLAEAREFGATDIVARSFEPTFSQQLGVTSVVRNAAGEIVEGNPNEIRRQRDVWTFARAMGSPDPNWQLSATGE